MEPNRSQETGARRQKSGSEKAAERQKRMDAAGIPDSKPFAAEDAGDPYAHVRELHIGGKRVGEFPEDVIARISYEHTDEAIEERNQTRKGVGVRVVRDELAKTMQHRREFREAETEVWEAPDPMGELVEKHVGPGMSPKFLSPDAIKRRGMRGYTPVMVKGEPVKLGNMILAEMPKERAKVRNEHYRRIGQQQQQQLVEKYQEEQGRLISDGKGRSGSRLDRPDPDEGLHSSRGAAFDE